MILLHGPLLNGENDYLHNITSIQKKEQTKNHLILVLLNFNTVYDVAWKEKNEFTLILLFYV